MFNKVGLKTACNMVTDVSRDWLELTRGDDPNLELLDRIDVYERCAENPHSLSRVFIEDGSFRIALYTEKIREACAKLKLFHVAVIFFLLSHEVGHFAAHVRGDVTVDDEERFCDGFALEIAGPYLASEHIKDIKERMLALR